VPSSNVVTLGLMGLGVVGGGVARILHEKEDAISSRVGCPVRVKAVLVRDTTIQRQFTPPGASITSDPADLLRDPDVQIVVEVMGGERPALDYIQQAIRAGKHVVTANKEVLAKHGPEILALAQKHRTSVRFEASVGGGIPIIGPLLQDLLANDITGIRAIINGTTNYVLTQMAGEGVDFDDAVRQAQVLGYAEADPGNDIEGLDAAYKLAIMATLAFHTEVHVSDVYHEGISKLTAADFRYAAELGYVIKLLAVGKRSGSIVQARVHPAFVPVAHPLAKVDGVFNAVELEGDLVGQVMFHGRGAGEMPTTSAVIADVIEIARSIASGGQPALSPKLDTQASIQPMADLETQYYLRLIVVDKPGVMAQITRVLGDMQVSLASVIQKETIRHRGLAEIVITTHVAREEAVQEAVHRLGRLEVVNEFSNVVRIEDRESGV
jgi:homoserine dehydrogenase